MSKVNSEISSAKILASLISGSAGMSTVNATVQRSHRFPLGLMLQMENMAKMAGVSVSVIINQILESGIEAVLSELPEKTIAEISHITQDQLDRPTKTIAETVKPRSKLKPIK